MHKYPLKQYNIRPIPSTHYLKSTRCENVPVSVYVMRIANIDIRLFICYHLILQAYARLRAQPLGEAVKPVTVPYPARLDQGRCTRMYAIIQTGGKQYRVSEGDVISVEKLDAAAGEAVSFDQVLTVVKDDSVQVGKPYLASAKVTAKVVDHGKGKKILVFKYKAKSNYRRRQGHRQPFTKVVIEKIEA